RTSHVPDAVVAVFLPLAAIVCRLHCPRRGLPRAWRGRPGWCPLRARRPYRGAWRSSMQCRQPVVQELRCEILSVLPRDRRETVVDVELREHGAVAQRFHRFADQLIGEIDDALAAIVELQPDLIVAEV